MIPKISRIFSGEKVLSMIPQERQRSVEELGMADAPAIPGVKSAAAKCLHLKAAAR
jgi:hypothetical protein